jgi:hypothetical protein
VSTASWHPDRRPTGPFGWRWGRRGTSASCRSRPPRSRAGRGTGALKGCSIAQRPRASSQGWRVPVDRFLRGHQDREMRPLATSPLLTSLGALAIEVWFNPFGASSQFGSSAESQVLRQLEGQVNRGFHDVFVNLIPLHPAGAMKRLDTEVLSQEQGTGRDCACPSGTDPVKSKTKVRLVGLPWLGARSKLVLSGSTIKTLGRQCGRLSASRAW